MGDEMKREIEQLVEKNRRLLQELDQERDRRREEARKAQESLRRAQEIIRKAGAAAG